VFPDVDSDNENTINQKEIDCFEGLNKHYRWDEDKKEFNLGWRRVSKDLVGYNEDQIQRAEARKKREHNLTRKYFIAIYMNFDADQFDINEDYEKEWTKTYNKHRVKLQYEIKKRIMVIYHLLHL
jgi:hypothetical protein